MMNRKTSSLNVRINSDLKQKVVQEAQKIGMTVTEYVEYILNKVNSGDSEPIMSDSISQQLKTISDGISVLDEIKGISHKNVQNSSEILNKLGTSQEDRNVIKDNHIQQKLIDLLEVMKGEEIRYNKDGEPIIGEANSLNDVLAIIIHNYHSLILNKY